MTETETEIHEDFRSGAKLAGELADEFESVETTNFSSSGDSFIIRIGEFIGDHRVFDMAAKHGFRVSARYEDERIGFARMDNDPTDPRNNGDD
jgi:uncharacterized protein YjgD (DUF1641 family)